MAHRGERQFFDDPYQVAQAGPHDSKHLQRNLWMSQAQRLEILLADEQQSGMFYRSHRCRVISTIKHRQFGYRAAGPIDAQHLLAAVGRALENSDMPGLDHIQACARLAFLEDCFSRLIASRDGSLRQKAKFVLGQTRENRHFRESCGRTKQRFRHRTYCTECQSVLESALEVNAQPKHQQQGEGQRVP
jgi:hypothetical protein